MATTLSRWIPLCPRVLRFCGSLLPLLLATAVGATPLVEKGKGRAIVVLADQPSPASKRAAVILQEHIQQISGAKLPIRKESDLKGDPSPQEPWILVGEGSL